MLLLTLFCITVFVTQGLIIAIQGSKITELSEEVKSQDKRLKTLEEILSRHDAALEMRIKLGKHRYNPNKDPTIKQFTDKLNRL